MTPEQAYEILRSGFSADYWQAFGSKVAVEVSPGTYICPACKESCSYTGHSSCQREYVAPTYPVCDVCGSTACERADDGTLLGCPDCGFDAPAI